MSHGVKHVFFSREQFDICYTENSMVVKEKFLDFFTLFLSINTVVKWNLAIKWRTNSSKYTSMKDTVYHNYHYSFSPTFF